jgi:hypothetical protein
MIFIKGKQEREKVFKLVYSLFFLSVFILIYSFLWPAFWNFVIFPKVSPASHGVRIDFFKKGFLFNSSAGTKISEESYMILDRAEHSALASAVWEVPVSGKYRFLLESDSTCALSVDGKTLLKIQGFYPQNGTGIVYHLEKGPHLLLFKLHSGPNKGWVDFKIQPPGETAFSRIIQRDLRYVKLNNFPEWWYFILFFKGALILGLGLILFFFWRPELITLFRSKSLLAWLLKRNPLIWVLLGLLMSSLVLGIWPFFWNYFLDTKAHVKNPGMQVDVFAGKGMIGNPIYSFSQSSSTLTVDSPQSSLRAYAIWHVPQAGQYQLTLSCYDYGSLTIDDQLVISFPERAVNQTETVPFYLTQGPHFLLLRLTSYVNPLTVNLVVTKPGSQEAFPLTSQELSSGPIKDFELILKFILTGKYIGLIGLSLALILLVVRLGNWGKRLTNLLEQAPFPFYMASFSLMLALSLILRIFFLVDMHYPASGSKWVALGGLVLSFGALWEVISISCGKEIKKGIPGENGGFKGIETIGLMAIMSIATILRVLFLQNMEFKQDEMEMVHMAINLARDHIPYVVGNLTSHGNRNPPGLLYLLSLPALISHHPIHITFLITFINIMAVFMTYRLTRIFVGWKAATVAALLFACSPWAIRCSMKVWPCNCVVFFSLSLCLLLRTWYEKGGFWCSLLVGITAGMMSQLHFSSLLLLIGIITFSLTLFPKIPWRRLPVVLLAFVLLWLPYVYFQAKHGPDSGHIVKRYLKEFPGDNLEIVRNVYWEIGGFFLDSDEAIGNLGKEFRASVWTPIYSTFYVWVALVLFGFFVFEFWRPPDRPPPDGPPVDWLKLYIWAVVFALTVEIMMNVRADMSYVEFVFPWPFILAGLGFHHLQKTLFSKNLGRPLFYLPFVLLVLLITISGSAYFWSWQNLLGRTGGDGEYGTVFYRQEAAKINYIQTHRPIPGPLFGPETKYSW